ncbi:SDR family oxidoreductase [Granulosicoccaceae sp. 1_MG-2023]|nr:SDR family oxidoreductase [Granulosicoccaceae sp. 1_MG-2023]
MSRRVVIAGCGDIGTALARALVADGDAVTGMVSSASGVARLAGHGIKAVACDLDKAPERLPAEIAGADLVYWFVPPPRSGQKDIRSRAFLALQQSLPRCVVISTTGVYGDCQGAWIDETRPAAPGTARAARRLDAERRWQDAATASLMILRVGGIYGPGKWPLARLKREEPVLARDQSPYSNRIHRDDLVRICRRAADVTVSGVFNAVDDAPGTMSDYFIRVAQHFGLPVPREISRAQAEQVLGEGIRSYLGESRRIRNDRLKAALGISLKYPTLAEGLAAAGDQASDSSSLLKI